MTPAQAEDYLDDCVEIAMPLFGAGITSNGPNARAVIRAAVENHLSDAKAELAKNQFDGICRAAAIGVTKILEALEYTKRAGTWSE